MQAELAALEARATLVLKKVQLSAEASQLWDSIQFNRHARLDKVGGIQVSAEQWMSSAISIKKQLMDFLMLTDSTDLQVEHLPEAHTAKLFSIDRLRNSSYWVKDDTRLAGWITYPGFRGILQR